ncbi:hypothetical protein [Methylocystis bryophila]|nr:hypothetical protein [Methylocystis bryophila]BDV37732.1 hypothetical protein DSM21852_09850 [Methylocystis bryophila]
MRGATLHINVTLDWDKSYGARRSLLSREAWVAKFEPVAIKAMTPGAANGRRMARLSGLESPVITQFHFEH